MCDVNAHDRHDIDHGKKICNHLMCLPVDFFQEYTCAVCDMFSFGKTSQIHLYYTEINKKKIQSFAKWHVEVFKAI